jgi:hypothetical protein
MRGESFLSVITFCLVSSSIACAQEQSLSIEFSLFSGRPRPKAEVSDMGQAKAILDSLDVRSLLAVPCSEVPSTGSTPLYTGVLLRFTVPILDRRILVVHDGYISYDLTKPCYRDPEGNLEKLAVNTAFRYDDLSAPGGPKPMEYLACMVPDSLHPEIAACATGLWKPSLQRLRHPSNPGNGGRAEAAITLDGRRARTWRSGFYWSLPAPAPARNP